jgi:hypothetical protein
MLTFADIQIENNIENKSTNTLLGYILTAEDGWTEGLIKDSHGNKKFIFGTFTRYKSLQLYSLDSNKTEEVFEFNATKSPTLYAFYTGETFLIKDSNKKYVSPCKIASRLLEKDPRDGIDTAKETFITSLKKWKDSNITAETAKLYQKFLSNKDILTKNIELDKNTDIR